MTPFVKQLAVFSGGIEGREMLSLSRCIMSNSLLVRVSRDNSVSLPGHICEKLKIKAGDRLLADVQDGSLILLPRPADLVNHMAGLHREIWQDVNTTAYLNEECEA